MIDEFAEYFDDLDDSRLDSKIHHRLLSVLMTAVLGGLCGIFEALEPHASRLTPGVFPIAS